MAIHIPPIPRSRILAAIAALELGDFGDPDRIMSMGFTPRTIRIEYLADDGRLVTLVSQVVPDTDTIAKPGPSSASRQ